MEREKPGRKQELQNGYVPGQKTGTILSTQLPENPMWASQG